jgi:hypothetical protein
MRPLRDHIQREVASLYAFVDAISRACSPAPQSVSYSESSSRFFDYIGHVADKTKDHIEGFEAHSEDSDEDFEVARAELCTIKASWRELHSFIKPSADADTLNQPTALLNAFIDRLQLVPGFDSTSFAIFHTDAFHYLQANPAQTAEVVGQLARIVDAIPFDKNLGLIGIPNSQGDALFINCLIAHEIGEYVFAKHNLDAALAPRVTAALGQRLGDSFNKSDRTDQSKILKAVLGWSKEVFCDLFAIRFVGPCYSFAYIDLFDLPNLLDKSGTKIVDDREPPLPFYSSHPSHPFRVRAQAQMLQEEGWWDFFKNIDARQCALVNALLALKDETFLDAERAAHGNDDQSRVNWVEALIDVLPEVKKHVVKATDGLDSGVHEFNQLAEIVCDYLRNGIVPSTLTLKSPAPEGGAEMYVEVHPSAITLINSAYTLYISDIEGLMSKIKDQSQSSAQKRSYWMKRVENWTAKSLEDIALLRRSAR